jgi:hypothetical protein
MGGEGEGSQEGPKKEDEDEGRDFQLLLIDYFQPAVGDPSISKKKKKQKQSSEPRWLQ